MNDFMTPEQIQAFEQENVLYKQALQQKTQQLIQKRYSPHKKEYTNQVFCASSFSYVILLVIAVVTYYVFGEIPTEVVKWTSIVYGAVFVSYCGKCAYENKGGGR